MTRESILRPRSKSKHAKRRVGTAFLQAATVGGVAPDFPMDFRDPDEGKSKLATGGLSAAIHFGILGLLFLFASLNPEIVDEIIPVMLLREEAPKPPAPARRALAERRKLDFAPAMQTVQPQIVNKRVIAEAAPAINTEMLEMDSVNAAAAPTQVKRSAIDVDRVSAIGAVGGYQASKVEVNHAAGPAVRGPIEAVGPVGPSVGPRKVAGTDGNSFGTGSLAINQGSSVRDGVLTSRDVSRLTHGPRSRQRRHGGRRGKPQRPGRNRHGPSAGRSGQRLHQRPEVQAYLQILYERIYARWTLPYGIENVHVTLLFAIDVAGSASSIQLVKGNNAIGASAIDAMRASTPFPPMPERVRCLANKNINATFSSSSVAS